MNEKTLSVLMVIFLLITCEEDTAGPENGSSELAGAWILQKTSRTVWVDGVIDQDDVDYFTIMDPYIFESVLFFQADTMSYCENDVLSNDYYCFQRYLYSLGDDYITLNELDDDDIWTRQYSLDMDTLTFYGGDVDTYNGHTSEVSSEITWTRYVDDFPPSEWLTPLSNDAYEPDNDAAEATLVMVSADALRHVWYPGDQDWFTFQAQGGTTYIIQTFGSYLHWLSLLDTDGITQLDVSESRWGNAEIEWTCPSSGNYYFKTAVHYEEGEDDAGAYYVSVVTG